MSYLIYIKTYFPCVLFSIFKSNPPFHMPLVELVPSPWTDKDAVLKAETILEETGQVPVVLKKEIAGYANNRIQCAMFSEIWRLVKVR